MFSVVILAGGFSSRMYQPKFLLNFNKKHTFIEEIIKQFIQQTNCQEIIIVVNTKQIHLLSAVKNINEKILLVENRYPEKERFYSIQCGLKALKGGCPVFLHNVDNPFVSNNTLNDLIRAIQNYDFAVPIFNNKGGHPILLSKKLVKDLVSEKKYNHNLKVYLKNYRRINVPVKDKNILVNINTREDYQNIILQETKYESAPKNRFSSESRRI